MALLRRNASENTIPEDLKPYYEGRNSAWRRWVGPVLRGLLLLVLIALIVWGGIWGIGKLVHRGSSNDGSTASNSSQTDNSNNKNDNSQSSGAAANEDKKKSDDNNSEDNKSDDKQASPAPAPEPAPTPAPAASNDTGEAGPSAPSPAADENEDDQLANTGPGEVLAAFFATVVMATLAYHFLVSYRVSGARK
jgi:cytoskeletal protein RodZ